MLEIINRFMLGGIAVLMLVCLWGVMASLARYDRRHAHEDEPANVASS